MPSDNYLNRKACCWNDVTLPYNKEMIFKVSMRLPFQYLPFFLDILADVTLMYSKEIIFKVSMRLPFQYLPFFLGKMLLFMTFCYHAL